MKVRLLFVCLGNICRSPAAEGIFLSMAKKEGIDQQISVDSAGTSAFHSGQPADTRMRRHAQERGYHLPSLARQFDPLRDFDNFDYILTMDESNYDDVIEWAPSEAAKAKVYPMISFCRIHRVPRVPDPYHDGEDGFRLVLDILEDSCSQLLKRVLQDLKKQN